MPSPRGRSSAVTARPTTGQGNPLAAQWFTSVPFGLNAQGMNTWLYHANGLALWEETYAPFGLVPRPAGNTGVQMGGWFNREIRSMEDLKGLKMRIPGLGGKVLAKAGATVVLLPAGEIYTSLERGVIDATEWVGPAHDVRMGFQKIAKFYYAPGWHEPGSALEIMINKKAYDALPKDLAGIIDAAAARLNVEMLAEFERENALAVNGLLAGGKVTLKTFPDQVLSGLKALSEEVLREEAGKDPQARKVHEAFLAFRKEASSWSGISEKLYYEKIF